MCTENAESSRSKGTAHSSSAGCVEGSRSLVTSPNTHHESGTEFENDLASPQSYPAHCLPKIIELSKLTFKRSAAQKWASEDIKFLIFDDTDTTTDEFNQIYAKGIPKLASQHSDADTSRNTAAAVCEDTPMETFAEETMIEDPSTQAPTGDLTNHDLNPDGFDSDVEEQMMEYAKKLSREANSDGRKTSHEAESRASSSDPRNTPCKVCAAYPEFPHRTKPRTFRLVRPAITDVCQHYIAVSYCWSGGPKTTAPNEPKTPAPENYLVRDLDGHQRPCRASNDVLDRAVDVANSCGLQSSSQADKDEHSLGVQSMDIVYNRAKVTAGLLDVQISSEWQMRAINTLIHQNEDQIRMAASRQFVRYALEFLKDTTEDLWYTRAWVIQESLCAGSKLVLACRLSPGLEAPSKLRWTMDGQRPPHNLDTRPDEHTSELYLIPLSDFWNILDRMQRLLGSDFIHNGKFLLRTSNGKTYSHREAGPIIAAAEGLHPRFARSVVLGKIHVFGRGHYGKRPTVDAVGALTLLKDRGCKSVVDRLAILANMCDYNFRLDSQKIQPPEYTSLNEAMFALILNNGDLSVLVPEAYSNPAGVDANEDSHSRTSVLFKEFTQMKHVNCVTVRNYINIRLQSTRAGQFTLLGLQLPAYLWTVDFEVDFSLIKFSWAEEWDSIKCWRMDLIDQKHMTADESRLQCEHFARRLNNPVFEEQARREFREHGHIPNHSMLWNGIDHRGFHVDRVVIPQRVQNDPQFRGIVAKVIFGILRFLLDLSGSNWYAQGLADSIWQSVRVDQVGDSALPDQVTSDLFSHEDVRSQPFDTLQLDMTQDDRLAQLWFVERIMRYGSLWCGRYNRTERAYPDHCYASESHQEASESDPSSSSRVPQTKKGPLRTSQGETILWKQIRRAVFIGQMSTVLADSTDGLDAQSLHNFAENLYYDDWSVSAENRRVANLVSTFDVDGPCQVVTPYNPDWEMFPRPELRNMSTCWVVEPMGNDEMLAGIQARSGKGKEKVSSMGGMSDFFDKNPEFVEIEARWVKEGLQVFTVLRKVKGLWQIMTPPMQQSYSSSCDRAATGAKNQQILGRERDINKMAYDWKGDDVSGRAYLTVVIAITASLVDNYLVPDVQTS
ncbi:hypothetical protein OPT61_g4192 [Boeremia exigua]|uniref:Uncharacterized protein n=1 Tax=Boeremia exigua TaxID=749465 RepID=A0ACC2IEZ4_9PLEO|nr:hypothetical protein OPT61_g4192 [Boeremia exigua]